MTAATHVSTPGLVRRDGASGPRPFRFRSGWAAIAAVGAVAALATYGEMAWHGAPTVPSPQPLPPLSAADATPAFANPVDWSKIAPADDPGPMAVAAYGP